MFKALTNDKSVREILMGSQEDFEHFKSVIKSCFELTQARELRALTKKEKLSDEAQANLEKSASGFVSTYVRQHCSVYADLKYEIQETDLPPKKEPKEGEEEEEEDDETKEKRKRNEESKAKMQIILPQLFYTFIMLAEKYGEQLDALRKYLGTLVNTPATFLEAVENISICFDEDACQQKNLLIMIFFFNFIEIEITWFDEVAEGLKVAVEASHLVRNFVSGLPSNLTFKVQNSASWGRITLPMRQCIYTLGVIANQLIAPQKSEEEEKKEKEKEEEEAKKATKIDFKKLFLLQGGLESRFIPELSDKTKELIEGFFKIT